WDNLGVLTPFEPRYGAELGELKTKELYAITLLVLIPFLLLGLSFIYLGLRPTLGLIVAFVLSALLASVLLRFMHYRAEPEETIYGLFTLIAFFAGYFGWSKVHRKPWLRKAQSASVVLAMSILYGLLIFGPSLFFVGLQDAPPVWFFALPLLLMAGLWVGPVARRLTLLHTIPAAK
ncbi:MAG: hypothetical protein AAFP02_07195, partial [Bacteroidota bacterium]